MKEVLTTVLLALLFSCCGIAQERPCQQEQPTLITLFDSKTGSTIPGEKGRLELPGAFANQYLLQHDPSRGCWRNFDKVFFARPGDSTSVTAPPSHPGWVNAVERDGIGPDVPYYVTSTVTSVGNRNKLTVELKAACSEDLISKAEVTFDGMADTAALRAAGEQAAKQLLPLKDKIAAHAKELRANDTRHILDGKNAILRLVALKKRPGLGETTTLEIEAIDSDGFLLANRKVSFSPETINGIQLPGTTGGIVTPATVITDANGRAKVTFKLTSINARVFAHINGLNGAGCPDVIKGAIYFGAVPLQISVYYDYTNMQRGDILTKLLNSVDASLGMHSANFKRHVLELIYYPKAPLKEKFTLDIGAQPISPDRITYFADYGAYLAYTGAGGTLASLAMDGSLDNSGFRQRFLSGKADPKKRTRLKIDWNGNDGDEVQLEFSYKPKAGETLNDPAKDAYFFRTTNGATFIKKKITDEKSPFKSEYQMTLHSDIGLSDKKALGTMMDLGVLTFENITVVILSPYE
jgi:hypothetical protein